MPDNFDSKFLEDCLNRWREGDRAAADELLRLVITRLEKLSRRMLRAFPTIRGTADTDDVLQNSLVRLLRTLQCMKPNTPRDFFNLAAVHIRRELIDLYRRNRGRESMPLHTSSKLGPEYAEPAIPILNDADLWVLFHEAVDRLPVEEREIVGLTFYHGWTQRRIAELFQVDERTIRRRWASARQRLQMMVGADFLEI